LIFALALAIVSVPLYCRAVLVLPRPSLCRACFVCSASFLPEIRLNHYSGRFYGLYDYFHWRHSDVESVWLHMPQNKAFPISKCNSTTITRELVILLSTPHVCGIGFGCDTATYVVRRLRWWHLDLHSNSSKDPLSDSLRVGSFGTKPALFVEILLHNMLLASYYIGFRLIGASKTPSQHSPYNSFRSCTSSLDVGPVSIELLAHPSMPLPLYHFLSRFVRLLLMVVRFMLLLQSLHLLRDERECEITMLSQVFSSFGILHKWHFCSFRLDGCRMSLLLAADFTIIDNS
jgi:hypothetical protein